MPSHALTGEQSKPIPAGHGKEGYVQLVVTVPPDWKTALIDLAVKNDRFVIDEVREALANHLNGGA